jgi:hypothetical protein
LSGVMAGTIVFCLWGAAVAGKIDFSILSDVPQQQTRAGIINSVTGQTMMMFLILFLGSGILGMLGGWLERWHKPHTPDVFDKEEPQMALNASITAVPASIVACALAAAVFPRLSTSAIGGTGESMPMMDLPVLVALLLVLISHLALTMVVPHEARQAEHRCGTDEVKMGAFVGIGTSPVLILFLVLVQVSVLSKPFVMIALLAVSCMSLISLFTLFTRILPRRASFPEPLEEWQMREASLFGSIAGSKGPRLVVLCIGCGFLMVLPLYIAFMAPLINVSRLFGMDLFPWIPESPGRLFILHAMTSSGLMAVSAVVLSAIYLFYLSLGRWFRTWNANRGK